MRIVIDPTKSQSGQRAARDGAALIRRAIRARGRATIVLATGASQFAMIRALARAGGIDWYRVTAFHLDEYAGMPITHPASFRLYLWQRFAAKLPVPLEAFHMINAESNCAAECRRLNALIRNQSIDVAFIGIGENGHLAFNDPPADFQTTNPYIIVNLDEACRRQQLGEGWFRKFADVPKQAVSMSCRQILKAAAIICTVPDRRKARAVPAAVQGPVTPSVPASLLQRHRRCTLYLDRAAASRL